MNAIIFVNGCNNLFRDIVNNLDISTLSKFKFKFKLIIEFLISFKYEGIDYDCNLVILILY